MSQTRAVQQRRQRRRRSSGYRNFSSDDSESSCIDLTTPEESYIDLTSGTPLRPSMVPVILPLTPEAVAIIGDNERGRNRARQERRNNRVDRSLEIISTPEPTSRLSSLRSNTNTSPGIEIVLESSHDTSLDVIDLGETVPRLAVGAVTTSPTPVKIACPICMDDDRQIKRSGRQLTSTVCGHIYCSNCIKQSLKTFHSCPTCRKPLRINQIHPIFL